MHASGIAFCYNQNLITSRAGNYRLRLVQVQLVLINLYMDILKIVLGALDLYESINTLFLAREQAQVQLAKSSLRSSSSLLKPY